MNEQVILRKIVIYAAALVCICGWAVFNIIPYSIAMYLATILVAFNTFQDAQEAKMNQQLKEAKKKYIITALLVASIVLIILLNP